jgi:hypothetical protein
MCDGDQKHISDNPGTVKIVLDALHNARATLESADPDLVNAASHLGIANRHMVRLFDEPTVRVRASMILSRIRRDKLDQRFEVPEQLTKLLSSGTWISADPNSASQLSSVRTMLEPIVAAVSGYDLVQQMTNRLQLKKLRALRNVGLVVLIILALISPLFVDRQSPANGPVATLSDESLMQQWLNTWPNALAVAAIGASGAFLSGLLQARNSESNFINFQSDSLKLQLRPIVGALVALFLFMLLSWEVLPGIKVENQGSVFLVAFLSGFSERYFLKLLPLGNEEATTRNAA